MRLPRFLLSFMIVASWTVESATGESSLRRKRNLIDVEQGYVSYRHNTGTGALSWKQQSGKQATGDYSSSSGSSGSGKGKGKSKSGKGDADSSDNEKSTKAGKSVVHGFYMENPVKKSKKGGKKGSSKGKGKKGGSGKGKGKGGSNSYDGFYTLIPSTMNSMDVTTPPGSIYGPTASSPKGPPNSSKGPPTSPTGPTAPIAHSSPSLIPSPTSNGAEFTPIPTAISSSTSIPVGTPSNTISPVQACQAQPRDTLLLESLSNVTLASQLNDITTPAGKAYQFLLTIDAAKIDPCTYPSVDQRFALSVLYFSTNGDAWNNKGGWLTAGNECDWKGVKCDSDGIVTDLALSSNNLKGPIPNEIRVLSSLMTFNLFDNALVGTLPDVFTSFPDLVLLDLEVNSLHGSPFVDITTNLEGYRVSFNNFTGTIPTIYGKLSNLKEFWISHNEIGGSIPTEFGTLTNLETVYVDRNLISGHIPSEFGDLDLVELQAHQNRLGGYIPDGLWNNRQLTGLRLDLNMFVGTISTRLGELTSLTDLRVGYNDFSGTLPQSLSNLSNLVNLLVNNNFLTGTIPDVFANFAQLNFTNFANNTLSGTIPPSIFNAPVVEVMYFSNNSLAGTIPTSIVNAVAAKIIFMDGNKLTGTVPTPLKPLVNLHELLLQQTNLEGAIPSALCALVANGTLTDIWADCKEITCSCCTRCF